MSIPATYWNHNAAFHRELVRDASTRGGRALDVGCGDGLLMVRLAEVCEEVIGVDTDPAALERARVRAAGLPAVRVVNGSVVDARMMAELGVFETVTCVATLHHLPMRAGLRALGRLVAPGGRLIVIGLARNESLLDWTLAILGVIPNRLVGVWRHEALDVGVPVAQPSKSLRRISDAARELLPGVRLRRRFHYRYRLTWDRPEKDR